MGFLHGANEQKGLLVGQNVAANLLAEIFGVAKGIEVIVLQLEGQPHMQPELVQGLAGLSIRSCRFTPHLQSCCQQD